MSLREGETRLGFGGSSKISEEGESQFYIFGKPIVRLQNVLGIGFKIFCEETYI